MNTTTQHEVHAIETAAPAQHLLLVPLLQLRPSKRNIRTRINAPES